MDDFWTDVLGVKDPRVVAKWAARGQNIEQTVRKAVVQNGSPHDDDWDPVARACGQIPFRALEIGSYCGYSALRIARNRELPCTPDTISGLTSFCRRQQPSLTGCAYLRVYACSPGKWDAAVRGKGSFVRCYRHQDC